MFTAAAAQADDANLVDDDLQRALARTRTANVKQRAATAAEIAQQVQAAQDAEEAQRAKEAAGRPDGPGMYEGGVVISEAAEFARQLEAAEQRDEDEAAKARALDAAVTATIAAEPKVESRGFADEMDVEEGEERGYASEEPEGVTEEPALEEEPLVGNGLAATLAMLKQKGEVKPLTAEVRDAVDRTKRQLAWHSEQARKEAQRTRLLKMEKSHRGGAGGGHLDERDDRRRQQERIREEQAKFKDYAPVVNLEKRDKYNNVIGPKEAFKAISHVFHGKAPGKKKTELYLRKKEEEHRMTAMNTSDTPLNLTAALRERQRETGSAHVTLSVGNRG